MLASGSADKTIVLWDTVKHKPLAPPIVGHTDLVSGLAFSPDGSKLASCSWDGSVRLWDMSLDAWQKRACGIVNGNLSWENWQRYIGDDQDYRNTCPAPPGS